jgi:dsRNA-specific ribonuclease
MYKSRLQELCQKRRWALSLYDFTREGPPHAPLFCATVVVNGETFSTRDEGKKILKEANNLAAMTALNHIIKLPAAALQSR